MLRHLLPAIVEGLNKGSAVNFQGVPVGQIEEISLLPDRPEFVWVRVTVDAETPILQGTTAQIKGVGFTGVSEIALEGAVKGAPAADAGRPAGLPGYSGQPGGLGALLNSRAGTDRADPAADRAADRAAIRQEPEFDRRHPRKCRQDHRTFSAERAPDLADAIGDARIAARNAGIAAQRVGLLADSTNQLVNDQGKPAAEDLAQGNRRGSAFRRKSRLLWSATHARASRISARTRCPR